MFQSKTFWHQGAVGEARKSKHWGVGRGQEEEAQPEVRKGWLEAHRSLGQKPLTPPEGLSWPPQEKSSDLVSKTPSGIARAGEREDEMPSLPSFSATLLEGVSIPESHPLVPQIPQASTWDFPGGSDAKESVCHARDLGLIPGLGRFPGEGNGCPLQCSCQENPMDIRAWRATVHGVTKSRTWLSDLHFHFQLSTS